MGWQSGRELSGTHDESTGARSNTHRFRQSWPSCTEPKVLPSRALSQIRNSKCPAWCALMPTQNSTMLPGS